MRLDQYITQQPITPDVPGVPISDNIPNPLATGMSGLSQGLLSIAERDYQERKIEKDKIKTARRNAEVDRIVNNFDIMGQKIFDRYERGEIDLDEVRKELDEYYESDLYEGVDDDLVIERAKIKIDMMREHAQLQIDRYQNQEIIDQAVNVEVRRLDNLMNQIIGSNFDPEARKRLVVDNEESMREKIGTIYDKGKIEEDIEKFNRKVWWDSYVSDLINDPVKTRKILDSGGYLLDQDQLTNAKEMIDVAERKINAEKKANAIARISMGLPVNVEEMGLSETARLEIQKHAINIAEMEQRKWQAKNYNIAQQKILLGEEVDLDPSQFEESDYLALKNLINRESEQYINNLNRENERFRQEMIEEQKRLIYNYGYKGEVDPDAMEIMINDLDDLGAPPETIYGLRMNFLNDYRKKYALLDYTKRIYEGEFSYNPETKEDDAEIAYENHVDIGQDGLKDIKGVKNIVQNFHTIPESEKNDLVKLLSSGDFNAAGIAFKRFQEIYSANPVAAAEIASDRSSPYNAWLYWGGAQAARGLPIENIVKTFQDYLTRYPDEESRKELLKIADSNDVTELINKKIRNKNIQLQAELRPLIRSFIASGIGLGKDANEAIETSIKYLEESPYGYGYSYVSGTSIRDYNPTYYTKMPIERVLGKESEFINEMFRMFLIDEELITDQETIPIPYVGSITSPPSSYMEEQKIYRPVADIDSLATGEFLIEMVSNNGTPPTLLRDENNMFKKWKFDEELYDAIKSKDEEKKRAILQERRRSANIFSRTIKGSSEPLFNIFNRKE